MNTIRRNIFETNSSSTHSVTISNSGDYDDSLNDLSILEIETGDYGWKQNTYKNIYDKLSYALTFALNSPDISYFEDLNLILEEKLPGVKILYDYQTFEEIYDNWDNESDYHGYIDHQSWDEASEIFNSTKSIRDFIFNTESYFETDNDNH